MKIEQPSVTLIWSTPNAERVIEESARTCYRSLSEMTEDSATNLIRKLVASGHHSVLEHATASFRIVCDRGVTHELVRHRIASFSQESTRYCNYSLQRFDHGLSVIQPPIKSEEAKRVWERAMLDAEKAYMLMIQYGERPEIARSVLPTGLKSEIVMTCNLREWRLVLSLRLAPTAHPQMREIMEQVSRTLVQTCPHVFEDLVDSEGKLKEKS